MGCRPLLRRARRGVSRWEDRTFHAPPSQETGGVRSLQGRKRSRPAGQPSPPAREGEEDKCEQGPLPVSWLFCFLVSRAFPTSSPTRPALRLSPARSAIQAPP